VRKTLPFLWFGRAKGRERGLEEEEEIRAIRRRGFLQWRLRDEYVLKDSDSEDAARIWGQFQKNKGRGGKVEGSKNSEAEKDEASITSVAQQRRKDRNARTLLSDDRKDPIRAQRTRKTVRGEGAHERGEVSSSFEGVIAVQQARSKGFRRGGCNEPNRSAVSPLVKMRGPRASSEC